MVMQVRRTLTVGAVPTGLAEGQISVGMADAPPTAWVGVPASVNPSGVIPITGLVRTVAGAPQPAGALGQLWWDEDAAQLFVYTGNEWVVAVNPPLPDVSVFATKADLAALQPKETTVSDTAPPTPANGDLWFDTSTGNPTSQQLNVWNGSAWVPASQADVSGFLPLTGGTIRGNLSVLEAGNLNFPPLPSNATSGSTFVAALSCYQSIVLNAYFDDGAGTFRQYPGTGVGGLGQGRGAIQSGSTGLYFNWSGPLADNGPGAIANLASLTPSTFTVLGDFYSAAGSISVGGNVQAAVDVHAGVDGWKPNGGPWGDSSDARIKTIDGDYVTGLEAIKTLQPRHIHYIGNDTDAPPIGDKPYENSSHRLVAGQRRPFISLIAQEVETAFPEMVTKREAYIDGNQVDDLRMLDTGPLVYALVNAVKELADKVAALEAK